MVDDYLTTEEVADLFKKSVSWVHQNWPKWKVEFGVAPMRANGTHKGQLMWKKSQLVNMAEKQWVIA